MRGEQLLALINGPLPWEWLLTRMQLLAALCVVMFRGVVPQRRYSRLKHIVARARVILVLYGGLLKLINGMQPTKLLLNVRLMQVVLCDAMIRGIVPRRRFNRLKHDTARARVKVVICIARPMSRVAMTAFMQSPLGLGKSPRGWRRRHHRWRSCNTHIRQMVVDNNGDWSRC